MGQGDCARRVVPSRSFKIRLRRLATMSALAAGSALALPVASSVASASTAATATISGGTLNIVVPGTIGFSDTLNGLNQTTTAVLAMDVQDATGTGAGWNVTATSTQFTSGSNTLATNSVTVPSAPTDTCDSGATCTPATNSVAYPYALPAGAGPPTATKLFNAAASTGQGDQTVTPTFSLAVPADTVPAAYTSTWTISVVSGP
ncbi:MAG: WxL domain-containing protein [Acidimicrobiales bacterium]